MTKQEEIKRVKRLTVEMHQFTEKFKAWVNGDFKQLSTMTDALVIDTDLLVKQGKMLLISTKACVKLSNDLVALSARASGRSRGVLLKIEKAVPSGN